MRDNGRRIQHRGRQRGKRWENWHASQQRGCSGHTRPTLQKLSHWLVGRCSVGCATYHCFGRSILDFQPNEQYWSSCCCSGHLVLRCRRNPVGGMKKEDLGGKNPGAGVDKGRFEDPLAWDSLEKP